MTRHPWQSPTLSHAVQCALRGLGEAWRTQRNLRLHAYAAAAVIAIAAWLRLTLVEWLWLSFAIGLVVFAELINTAIEQTVDLTIGQQPDPRARQVKDLAAGCVLVAAAIAAAIGAAILGPHVLRG